jgi:hypothetical protein
MCMCMCMYVYVYVCVCVCIDIGITSYSSGCSLSLRVPEVPGSIPGGIFEKYLHFRLCHFLYSLGPRLVPMAMRVTRIEPSSLITSNIEMMIYFGWASYFLPMPEIYALLLPQS